MRWFGWADSAKFMYGKQTTKYFVYGFTGTIIHML